MIGKAHQIAIVTIDERISKLRLAYPVKSKHKENVSAAIRTMLEPVAEAVDSITYDNGKEFSWHQQVNKSIKWACRLIQNQSNYKKIKCLITRT